MRDQYDMEMWSACHQAFSRDLDRLFALLFAPFKVHVRRSYAAPWRDVYRLKACKG